ncbi:glycogen debranching N-terminal domain-containing protein [Gloeobacter kilaueensis]|uniref:Amylo-alpha-16-glucosidase n=1 Tax=Gloeobacter kilaueensis (strain ATCC BAA-2537 / CCAP 1431/1 / ULC 316 / JS1) TaxID=1183438 RepID=U5QMA6_GLOK1|nr:glycogen debranching N-terminal domain-containing protein [Gloeobacter kilaueensis]AGY60046.1 amylo-alpha-16-glucosidase [Gloeobacter kilaueensis JS1]
MPVKVTVNPGQVVINDGSTFLVTASDGSIDENLAQGFFVRDTRLISYYEITLNRCRLSLLASSTINHHSALYQFTNPEMPSVGGPVKAGQLIISVRRDVAVGMHEDIDIANHASGSVRFQLMLAIRSDFADIFQVKSRQLLVRGQTTTTWDETTLTTTYSNGSFRRGIIVLPCSSDAPPRYANGRLIFDIQLEAGRSWHTCIDFTAVADSEQLVPARSCSQQHRTEANQLRDDFVAHSTHLHSSNAEVNALYRQALEDMGALRIAVKDNDRHYWMPAAGIPWFVAVFGRDSIIASLQTMAVHPELASGTLLRLAMLQAEAVDDWHDAQPGKILHELRSGELTELGELPYTPYYGTVDATPLWAVTLAESYDWLADRQMLDLCRPALERALAWIDRYGDFDGDGFVEYLTHSQQGLRNQGWKDSGDAIVYPDGQLVEPPIALCEVQGYVYDAWRRAAQLFEVWGEADRARKLRSRADALFEAFNERFWMEEEGFYCLGLDRDKQPIRSITSNPGQLLVSSIVPPERAGRVVSRLFAADLWSGWGIRTLSSEHVAYNPISYQRGSVWPHDNAIIAAGLKRYGFDAEVARIAEGIFAAAGYFEAGRMPELFAGIERRADGFPVPYPEANVPQAWAAGAILLLIRTLLGLRAEASHHRLLVRPVLPDWLNRVQLRNLKVGTASCTLTCWREDERTRWQVSDLIGELKVEAATTPSALVR